MTRIRKNAAQKELFETSRAEELDRRVKELDKLISNALKRNDYEKAKEWTNEQESIIQELVELGGTEQDNS